MRFFIFLVFDYLFGGIDDVLCRASVVAHETDDIPVHVHFLGDRQCIARGVMPYQACKSKWKNNVNVTKAFFPSIADIFKIEKAAVFTSKIDLNNTVFYIIMDEL